MQGGNQIKELPFIVEMPEEELQKKGIFSRDEKTGRKNISVEKLKVDLLSIKEGLPELFQDMKKVGEFSLKQISVGIEVSAEGGISIIGSAKVGGKGAITLTFEQL